MARHARSIAGVLMGALVAVAAPGAAVAQQDNPAAAAQQGRPAGSEELAPEVAEAVRALKAAIQDGNVDKVAQTLTGSVLKDPPVARLLSQILGEAAVQRGNQFLAAVVERSSATLSAGVSGERGLQVMVQFTSGLTAGVLQGAGTNAVAAKELVQSVTSSALVGAAKSEGVLGQMARAVAAGVVQALSASNSPISGDAIAQVVQTGIGSGAVKVAGPGVTVNVIAGNGKPVEDLVLFKGGKQLDGGLKINIPGPPDPKPNPSSSS